MSDIHHLGHALAVLEELPARDLERLAHRWSPSAIRRRREAERDAAYRLLAAGHSAAAEGGRALAKALAAEVNRYAASAWRFERDRPTPNDPRRALLHRVLKLDDGKPLSASSIRRVLAGVA